MKKQKIQIIYFVITDNKSFQNPGYYYVLNNSLWNSKREVVSWLKRLRAAQSYYTDWEKIKIKSRKMKLPLADYGGTLGTWLYHPRQGLVFATSTWQGD